MTVPDDPESPPMPTPDASGEVTRVLAAERQCDRDAFDRVYALVEETAETLELSDSTVKRDWRRARAFLQRELERAGFTA